MAFWAEGFWEAGFWEPGFWEGMGGGGGGPTFVYGLGGGNLSSPRLYSRLSEIYDSGANNLSRWVPTS